MRPGKLGISFGGVGDGFWRSQPTWDVWQGCDQAIVVVEVVEQRSSWRGGRMEGDRENNDLSKGREPVEADMKRKNRRKSEDGRETCEKVWSR